MRQNAPSSSRQCFAAQGQLETRSQQTQSHGCHPAPRAIKTQPLSNCVVRACAYQRTRQRKMGIAKQNVAKALDNYLAKEGCFEDPFSKQILRNYQPCVSTPKTPEHHKERVNQKKHCQSQLMPNTFILQLWRNIPLTIMTLIVFCLEIMQWKEYASILTQDLERHLLELTLEPSHETWLKKAQLLICTVLPQQPNPNGCSSYWRSRFALRTWQGRNRNNKKCVLN